MDILHGHRSAREAPTRFQEHFDLADHFLLSSAGEDPAGELGTGPIPSRIRSAWVGLAAELVAPDVPDLRDERLCTNLPNPP